MNTIFSFSHILFCRHHFPSRSRSGIALSGCFQANDFFFLSLSIYIYRCTYSSRTRERESTYISFVLFSHFLLLLSIYLSLSMCDIWIVYTCICVEQSTPLSLMYKLLINTSIFCTYRWYVTCTLALVGRSPASS